MRCQTRGLLLFWIHSKHLFCSKNIHSVKNGPTKLCFSDDSSLFTDDSSLFTVWCEPFLAQGMFFEQNKCLEWIQNHNKPLVWHLSYFLACIFILYSKVNGTPNLIGSPGFTRCLRQCRPLILWNLMTKWIEKTQIKSMSWHHRLNPIRWAFGPVDPRLLAALQMTTEISLFSIVAWIDGRDFDSCPVSSVGRAWDS